jgi:hypothetical protein
MRRADLRAGTPYLHVYWEPGSYLEQVSVMEIDRTSPDSVSCSSSADFASLKSLARRIRKNQSSGLTNSQEYASIRPSKVMRRTSLGSSDLTLFDGVSEISSVAAESDSMSWQPEGVNV